MGNQSLGETLAGSNLFVGALKANLGPLKRRGIDEGFVSSLEDLTKNRTAWNVEQEALKVRLKEKTQQIDEAVATLKSKLSEARKLVKMEIPQSAWTEFGIADGR